VSVGTLAKTSVKRMNNRSTGRFTEDYGGGSGRSAERTKGERGEASQLAVILCQGQGRFSRDSILPD
jgi:hypothetical protein